ncbi:MAG: SMI1/KNR4 family protein [Polyangiales bacterium]
MSLWRVPVYLPYLQPPLGDAELAAAEKELGVRLPASYVELLREQNGGHLRMTNHPSGHAPVSCISGIVPNYPSILGRDWDDVKEEMAEAGETKPKDIDGLIPFCGDGHYFYCFDYRAHGAEQRVTYIDVETFGVDEELAPDFATTNAPESPAGKSLLASLSNLPFAVRAVTLGEG